MSGLALFFHNATAESNSNNNSSIICTYDTSLVDTTISSIHGDIGGQNERRASSAAAAAAASADDDSKDSVPWKTHSEWKKWQKDTVKEFLCHRIFPTKDEQQNQQQHDALQQEQSKVVEKTAAAALNGQEEKHDDDDDDEESAQFETQQEVAIVAHHHQQQHHHHHSAHDDNSTVHNQDDDENSSSIIQQQDRISRRSRSNNHNTILGPIPFIGDTFGSCNVHYVADLDMQCNIVHLARLSLDRTWPLRLTRRLGIKSQSWRFSHPLQNNNRPLGRFIFDLAQNQEHQQRHQQQQDGDLTLVKQQQEEESLALMSSSSLWYPGEDDGPLAIVYHDVLNMEVHQILAQDDDSVTSLRRRAEAPFLTTATSMIATTRRSTHKQDKDDDDDDCSEPVMVVPRRRLKIFLYNSYAKDMQAILAIIAASPPTPTPQGAAATAKVVFQLQNVPSWCIFPYSNNDNNNHYSISKLPTSTDWYDSHGDLAPYCVCIGDDSVMLYPKDLAPSCLTLPPNDTKESTRQDTDKSTPRASSSSSQSYMRFDHSSLCMHVGLVVTKGGGEEHGSSQQKSTTKTSADVPKPHHHDTEGTTWLVLREWLLTAKGLREVKPAQGTGGHVPENSSDDDDDNDEEYHDVNQQASGRSVFGEWYIEYQEREQQQQQQQQQQSTSTNGGGSSTVTPTLTTNTINTATDTAITNAETTVVNTARAQPETQEGRQRQATIATASPSGNDLTRQNTDKNVDGQAVIVSRSRSVLQSEQNEQETAAAVAAAAVNRQSTHSTTGPSNAPPTAATEADRSGGTRGAGSVNQAGQAPPIIGQRSEGMPSPRKRQRTMTHYSPLQDLRRALEEKKAESTLVQADLYAVVLGFGSPSRTKRGEWMMAVALVDESLPLPGETGEVRTVNLNIFSKQRDEMPQVQFAGDVLRAHRVKVQEWNDEIQLMGLRASSYVVFRADSNNRGQTDNLTVLSTAKNEFSWTEEDKDRFIKLWQWGQRRLFSHPTMKESQSFKLSQMLWLSDNRVEKYQDSIARGDVTLLVCAILEMASEKRSSATPRGFLRVWDGTGLPTSDPFPDDCVVNGYNASRDGDPPSCVVEKVAELMQELRRIRQNPNLQEPKAFTGRIGNVAIWEEPFWELVEKVVKVGSFIRLRNVHDTRIPSGIRRYLMVYSKSYLTPLPNMTYEVVRMLEAHNDRLLNNDPLNPSSGVLPLRRAQGYNNIRRSNYNSSTASVSRLAALATQPISTLFSGRVRIVGLIPSLSELASDDDGGGLDQICGAGRSFAVQLSDDDDSNRPPLDVILSGDSVAAASILGMSPNEAIQAQNNQQVMSRLGRITNNLNERSTSCWWWNAKVRSVPLDGAKYFVLESIDSL